jgi:molecular chaperone GrpE (heat shock protein)
MIFFGKHSKAPDPTQEALHRIEEQLAHQEDSLREIATAREAVQNQLESLDKQISKHDMAIENLLDEMQEAQENDDSARAAAEEQRRNQENLLALIASYQEQFWQIRRFFGEKDEAWSEQLALMEQTLENARIHCGITAIDQVGAPVDYALHEVIDLTDSDTCDKTVAEIYSPGYLYQGKVMKKAKIAAYRKTSAQKEET